LEKGLTRLRRGDLYDVDSLRKEALFQGKLTDFYEALRYGIFSFPKWPSYTTSHKLVRAIAVFEEVGQELGMEVDGTYKQKITEFILKEISKEKIDLEDAARYMLQHRYLIQVS